MDRSQFKHGKLFIICSLTTFRGFQVDVVQSIFPDRTINES